MRAYRLLSISGALTVIGSATTLLLHGGWQSAAAGLAIISGVGFALTFVVLGALSERRPPVQQSSPQTADGPRRVAVEPASPQPVETSASAPVPACSVHRARPPERARTA